MLNSELRDMLRFHFEDDKSKAAAFAYIGVTVTHPQWDELTRIWNGWKAADRKRASYHSTREVRKLHRQWMALG
jgi:hypothetical protein